MGLLQAIALEALSQYFPGLDSDSLRVDVLKGRVDLSDVVLGQGHVIAVAGFPFRLTHGIVGRLGLHVPWASIYSAPVKVSAHAMEMHFSEISFPNSQKEVFDAFRNECRRAKNRKLAEGEHAESAVTRTLQKLLPTLVHRIEADITNLKIVLHFADGERVSLVLETFRVCPVEISGSHTQKKSGGALAKQIVSKGLTISLLGEGGTKFAISADLIDVELMLNEGIYEVSINLSGAFSTVLDLSLELFLSRFRRRICRWTNAATFDRPYEKVSENPRSWLRYAVRATCERRGITRSTLSVNVWRQAIASFRMYKQLHLLRLRKSDALSEEEENQIRDLEDLLDADMILLLRNNARADVMAEEVSAFATKEWLSWVFFDRRMSEEREHLSAEIRNSLYIVRRRERGEHESGKVSKGRAEPLQALTQNWSHFKLSVELKKFSILFTKTRTSTLSLALEGCRFQAKLDSSMKAYEATLSMSEFALEDEHEIIACPAGVSTELENRDNTSRLRPFLYADLQNTRSGDGIFAKVTIAPFAGFLDVERFSTYSEVLRLLSSCTKPCGKEAFVKHSHSNLGRRKTATNFPCLNLEIDIPSVVVVLGFHGMNELDTTTQKWFLLQMHTFRMHTSDLLNDPFTNGSFHGSIKDVLLSTLKSRTPNLLQILENSSMQNSRCFHVSTDAVIEISGITTCGQMTSLEAQLTEAGLCALGKLWKRALLHLETRKAGAEEHSPVELHQKMNAGVESRRQYRFVLSTIRCCVLETSRSPRSPFSASFNVSELVVALSSTSILTATLKNARFVDERHGGFVQISGNSRQELGMQLEWCKKPNGTGFDLDMKFASAAFLMRPDSLHDVVVFSTTITEAFVADLPGSNRARSTLSRSDSQYLPTSNDLQSRISVLFEELQLKCLYEGIHIVLEAQRTFIVEQAGVVSGSVYNLECRDYSTGMHTVIVQNTSEPLSRISERRAISFNITPNSTSINIHSLQVTIVRSSIERIVGAYQLLVDSFERATNESITAQASLELQQQERCERPSRNSVSIQGIDVVIRIPVSSFNSSCICIAASLVTTTIGFGTFVLSLRKASLLTRSYASGAAPISPRVQQEASVSPESAVVVRGLDIDVSHAFKTISRKSELIQHRRSDWSLQVLSKAAFFITATQIHLLRLIPEVLGSTVQSTTESGTTTVEQNDSEAQTKSGHKSMNFVLSSFDHTTFKLQTQPMSVELLNDDDGGSVVSAIAFLELDPIRVSKRTVYESSDENILKSVTRWAIFCHGLRLEDRGPEVPLRLREVITTRRGEKIPDIMNEATLDPTAECGLAMHIISRVDEDGVERSSMSIQMKGLRIVPSPSLYDRLSEFVVCCSAEVHDLTQGCSSTAAAKTLSTKECKSKAENEESPVDSHVAKVLAPSCEKESPARKLSLKFSDTTIQVYGKGRNISESFVVLSMSTLKVSLLFTSHGELHVGSEIRCRGVFISIVWIPAAVFVPEKPSKRHVRESTSSRQIHSLVAEGNIDFLDGTTGPLLLRRSLTVPRERLRWNFFRQNNDNHRAEEVVAIPSMAVRLPTKNSDRITLVVPSVSVDVGIQPLLSIAYLLPRLDCLPNFDSGSEISLPPLQLSLGSIAIRVGSLTSVVDDPEDASHLKYVSIRSKCSFDGIFGRNLTGVTASVQLTVDVFDEDRGLRDRLCSPFTVKLEGHFSNEISISVHCDRLLRIVVSPLTIRALAGLTFSTTMKSTKPKTTRKQHKFASEKGTTTVSVAHVWQAVKWSMEFPGIALCCTAEDPRIQLLRLNLRQVRVSGSFPESKHERSNFKLVLDDLVLEDTFSWRLYGTEDLTESSISWMNIISGIRRNQGIDSRDSSLYYDSAHANFPVLLCEAQWQGSFENLTTHVRSRGLEINLNMAIAPIVTSWATSLSEALQKVQYAFAKRAHVNEATKRETHTFRVAFDNITINPLIFIISTKAPPPRIRDSLLHRTLTWLFGSESASGITVTTPRFVFEGECSDFDSFAQRIQRKFVDALVSRQVGRQLILQAPSISRLLRTLYTSFIRRRETDMLRTEGFRSKETTGLYWQKSRGLLDATNTSLRIASTHVRVHPNIDTVSLKRDAGFPG